MLSGFASLELDAMGVEGVRKEPKAGRAKLASSLDVEAKTIVMLCMVVLRRIRSGPEGHCRRDWRCIEGGKSVRIG